MLFAALASVVIASCYDGDTCTTTSGERVRLACIDTPELVGKRAEPAPAKAARDHLRNLVVGKKVGIRRITEDRYGRTVAELFLGHTNMTEGQWLFFCNLRNVFVRLQFLSYCVLAVTFGLRPIAIQKV